MSTILRGPRISAFLGRFGIDARRFWLLTDLFEQLSERGEMQDQFGRDGVTLRVMAQIYAVLTGLMSIALAAGLQSSSRYFAIFMAVTAFLLLTLLVSEAGNSLVNPVEGLVLAHQPVNGATYTAAKLMHLARIVLFLVPALNILPALVGMMVKGAAWFYPLIHLLAAFGVGTAAAFVCCALYGWLILLLPAQRLKAAAQLAGTLAFLPLIQLHSALARTSIVLPADPALRWGIVLALAAAVGVIVALGIRALSADYLIRVSGMMYGHRKETPPSRRRRAIFALPGGPPVRAGFAFVSKMARRDFQFRRQTLPILAMMILGWVPMVASGCLTDPFSGRFTTAHVLPHIFGFLLFYICIFLTYGNDFKGAWVFQLAPARAFRGFARGIYAALWIPMVAVPHLLFLLLFPWFWGLWQAGLFVAYSAALCSVYLALSLRIVDGVPFSRQIDPKRGAAAVPLMILGAAAIAIALGVQYFLVFRMPAITAAVTLSAAAAAYFLARSSVDALEASIRHDLSVLSGESGRFYQEIDV